MDATDRHAKLKTLIVVDQGGAEFPAQFLDVPASHADVDRWVASGTVDFTVPEGSAFHGWRFVAPFARCTITLPALAEPEEPTP